MFDANIGFSLGGWIVILLTVSTVLGFGYFGVLWLPMERMQGIADFYPPDAYFDWVSLCGGCM